MLLSRAIFDKMNELGARKTPFLFMINFLKTEGLVIPLDELSDEIQYEIHSEKSQQELRAINHPFTLKKNPISYQKYLEKFEIVHENLKKGNSFLTNLTCQTPIDTNYSLEQIYQATQAKYKVWHKDHFVSFSPETFVKIIDQKIYSFPMKGTIDASIENAKEKILQDKKEMAEHYTIVDLIRNDLSKVAKKVSVDRFRYIDEIQSKDGKLLQVSSEISGELSQNFHENLGDLFDRLLPAGSISGAPKDKTLSIIHDAENYDRNFYTGVFGVYDGRNLDSAVLIRFIEQNNDKLVFKSGGGITHLSEPKSEYLEMIQKIYVPIN